MNTGSAIKSKREAKQASKSAITYEESKDDLKVSQGKYHRLTNHLSFNRGNQEASCSPVPELLDKQAQGGQERLLLLLDR